MRLTLALIMVVAYACAASAALTKQWIVLVVFSIVIGLCFGGIHSLSCKRARRDQERQRVLELGGEP
jgi:ABC-type uncharacterized transport system permease subunit